MRPIASAPPCVSSSSTTGPSGKPANAAGATTPPSSACAIRQNSDPATVEPELIKGGLVAIWGDKPVAEIDGSHVLAVVKEARKRGGEGRSRKMHAALSILFSWLLREGRVTANPCASVWKPEPPEARERTLTDAEIAAFWRGCDAIGAPFGPLFKSVWRRIVARRGRGHDSAPPPPDSHPSSVNYCQSIIWGMLNKRSPNEGRHRCDQERDQGDTRI